MKNLVNHKFILKFHVLKQFNGKIILIINLFNRLKMSIIIYIYIIFDILKIIKSTEHDYMYIYICIIFDLLKIIFIS